MTTKTKPLTQRQAEQLWSELRDLFVNAEQVIIKIIETKAWEPLGYDTFAQAWAARMGGVRLASACTAHVVYALLNDGLTNSEISEVAEVAPTVAQRLREQRARKVPATIASTNPTQVRTYERTSVNRVAKTLHLELRDGELADYKAMCSARGLDFKAEALKAVRAHFARLEKIR